MAQTSRNSSSTRTTLTGYAQVLEERDATGALARSYSYGSDLLTQSVAGLPVSSNFYAYDAIGSTRLLTAPSGISTDHYAYEAFGNQLAHIGSHSNRYRYTGEQTDDSLRMQYLRARLLSTGLGRFGQMDKIESSPLFPEIIHRYNYAAHNPVHYTDPSGYFPYTSTETMFVQKISELIKGKHAQMAFQMTKKVGCVLLEAIAEEAIAKAASQQSTGSLMPKEFHMLGVQPIWHGALLNMSMLGDCRPNQGNVCENQVHWY